MRRVRRLFDIAAAALREPRASAVYLSSLPEAMRGLAEPAGSQSQSFTSYVDRVTSGPGVWKWRHYLDIYHRHLSKFVGTHVEVVEVGVYSGGSLRMWRDYFGPGCHVSGVDVQPACKRYEDASTAIYIGDQADRAFWQHFRAQVPAVDVLIDDGGHQPEQQMVTLEEMLPHLRPGGVYICEDIHGSEHRFAWFAHGLVTRLNDFRDALSGDRLAAIPTPFQAAVASIHVYPFAVVIEKTARTVESFEAPKLGTEWQPFLQQQ